MSMKRFLILGILLSLLAVFFFLTPALARTASHQTTTFINVGQGDAALLSDGSGFNVLIDGGEPAAGPGLVTYLHSQGITHLNVMLASHADSDHIGGLINVLDDPGIAIDQVLYNGYPGATATWTSFVNAVAAKGLALTTAQFPQVFTWGQMTAHIMNPTAGLVSPETNAASVVVAVDYAATSYLFTGDIDSTVEATIIARGTPLAADILKVAHHGSASSSSADFLAAVHPKDSSISVGQNSYGQPSPLTISRLETAGSRVWRTDRNGNISVDDSGTTYSILPQFTPFAYSFYLPQILHATSPQTTPTPATPTPVTPTPPAENVQCSTVGATKLCAWVSNATPAQNSTVTVYGSLLINAVAQPGQTMNTAWHYKSTTPTCSGITDSSGTASCGRSIGAATQGYRVNIDVSLGGYAVTTWFTPN